LPTTLRAGAGIRGDSPCCPAEQHEEEWLGFLSSAHYIGSTWARGQSVTTGGCHILGRVRPLTLTLAVAVLGLLAGCGGEGPVKKGDYIVRADAICNNAVRATRSIRPPTTVGTQQQRLDALSQYLGKLVPIVQSEASQISALKRPSGTAQDKAALDHYLGALTNSASDYRDLAAAAKRGDAQGVSAAEAALRASPIASLAATYGLRACGNAGSTTA
jgi:hypothetical protein